MNILSLFGGIEGGCVACKKAGLPINNYFSSEIDKYAIQIVQKNHPEIIQLGNVENWREWQIDWASVDLLIGGSPCQGFSIAGKQLNFTDERSKLFFVYFEILDHIKRLNPNVKFLLENVKMKQDFQDIITGFLNVRPIEINSALVSAQNRKRLYWTNITGVKQPEDKHILLKDIIHENTWTDKEKSYGLTASYGKGSRAADYFEKRKRQLVFENLAEFIVPYEKARNLLEMEVERGKIYKKGEIYYVHGREVTLDYELFGIVNYPRGNNSGGIRYDGQKAPTLTSNKFEYNNHLLFGCMAPNRLHRRQNGQRFNNGEKIYTLTAADKHGILIEGYLRMLTPVECERLQTFSEGYTEGVSKTQRYKMLGNAWTVDVIAHILKNLRGQNGY